MLVFKLKKDKKTKKIINLIKVENHIESIPNVFFRVSSVYSQLHTERFKFSYHCSV